MRSSKTSRMPVALGALALTIAGIGVLHAGATAMRPPATPTAVVSVNLSTVLEGLDEKAKLEAELQTELDMRQQQLDEIVSQLEDLREEIENVYQPGTKEHKDKVREYRELENLLKTRRDFHNLIISLEKGAILRELYTDMRDAVAEIAERDGYDIVLIDDSQFDLPEEAPVQDMNRAIVSTNMLYVDKGVDISREIVDLLNAKFAAGD